MFHSKTLRFHGQLLYDCASFEELKMRMDMRGVSLWKNGNPEKMDSRTFTYLFATSAVLWSFKNPGMFFLLAAMRGMFDRQVRTKCFFNEIWRLRTLLYNERQSLAVKAICVCASEILSRKGISEGRYIMSKRAKLAGLEMLGRDFSDV